ncbi:MAG TPA: HD family phosphohydrolase, partial [Bdellovibrionota bacterium]|nr:HD family phosphohydrolase [Bdellovibrionota bacterium]
VALVMLADACEASSRVIEKPNPERIQAACEKVIFGFFQDGQLDESELTLRDLNLIIQCFTRVLMGVYHQRIKYPGNKKDEDQRSKQEVQKDSDNKGKKILTALGTRASDRNKN